MLTGINTPLSAHPPFDFLRRYRCTFQNAFFKFLFGMAIFKRRRKRAGSLIRGSRGFALLSEDQTSHSLIWSDLGELSSEVIQTTEDSWYQSDWVMNGSTVWSRKYQTGMVSSLCVIHKKKNIWRCHSHTDITHIYLDILVIKKIPHI